jgi:hypothetical protein
MISVSCVKVCLATDAQPGLATPVDVSQPLSPVIFYKTKKIVFSAT